MNQKPGSYPSAVPEGETVVAENLIFVNACMSVVSIDASSLGWRLGKSVLTHSDVWGLVWRIDFQVPGQSEDSELINRFICWGSADDGVLGTAAVCRQNIEPL
jgi:hypothetical protein